MTSHLSATTQPRAVGAAAGGAAGARRYAAATDVGRVRAHNEDSYHADAELGLWLVADGMGGHGGGDVASRIAAARVAEACHRGKALVDAIQEAHAAVVDAAARGEGTDRMGSTIVALRTRDQEYEIAWVGDSRAYLWDGRLRQLTRDHSLVQEYLDQNLISPEAAASDPRRGVITRCLGPANTEALAVDSVRGRWHGGERILLCSDGLHEVAGHAAMTAILADDAAPGEAVERLIEAALQAGGPDNVTAVLVVAPAGAADAAAEAREPGGDGKRGFWFAPLAALIGILLLATLVIVWIQLR